VSKRAAIEVSAAREARQRGKFYKLVSQLRESEKPQSDSA